MATLSRIVPLTGFFRFVPLFGLVLLGYWLAVKAGIFPAGLDHVVFQMSMPSGSTWEPTEGDFMALLSIVTLYFEVFKSTRTGDVTIVEHLFSTFVFVGFLANWLVSKWAGNSVFLILTAMSFLDVISGFTITISAARRDLSVGGKL